MRSVSSTSGIVVSVLSVVSAGALTACGGDGQTTAAAQTNILHSFGGETPFIVAPTALIAGNDGNFYGTALGGANEDGVVFKVTPAGVATVIYSLGESA